MQTNGDAVAVAVLARRRIDRDHARGGIVVRLDLGANIVHVPVVVVVARSVEAQSEGIQVDRYKQPAVVGAASVEFLRIQFADAVIVGRIVPRRIDRRAVIAGGEHREAVFLVRRILVARVVRKGGKIGRVVDISHALVIVAGVGVARLVDEDLDELIAVVLFLDVHFQLHAQRRADRVQIRLRRRRAEIV